MHRFSLSLNVSAVLVKLCGLAFCGYRFLHLKVSHTRMHVRMKAARSHHCLQALSADQLAVYLQSSDAGGRGRSEKNDMSSSQNCTVPQGRKALPASLSAPLFTQESLSNTRIIGGWPVLHLLHTPSLQIYGTSLLDPPSPQTILQVLRISTLTSTHFSFPPHKKFHSCLSLLILPLQQKALLHISCCTQSIFQGIKSTAASSDVSRFEWKFKKNYKTYIRDIQVQKNIAVQQKCVSLIFCDHAQVFQNQEHVIKKQNYGLHRCTRDSAETLVWLDTKDKFQADYQPELASCLSALRLVG